MTFLSSVCSVVSTIADHFMIYLILPDKSILLLEWWLFLIALVLWIVSAVWAYKRGSSRHFRQHRSGLFKEIYGSHLSDAERFTLPGTSNPSDAPPNSSKSCGWSGNSDS